MLQGELSEMLTKALAEREKAADEIEKKKVMASNVVKTMLMVLPKLHMHSLRVGLSGAPQEEYEPSYFKYADAEKVHNELEDCRDRIVQEQTIRKMQKRAADQRASPASANAGNKRAKRT